MTNGIRLISKSLECLMELEHLLIPSLVLNRLRKH